MQAELSVSISVASDLFRILGFSHHLISRSSHWELFLSTKTCLRQFDLFSGLRHMQFPC